MTGHEGGVSKTPLVEISSLGQNEVLRSKEQSEVRVLSSGYLSKASTSNGVSRMKV